MVPDGDADQLAQDNEELAAEVRVPNILFLTFLGVEGWLVNTSRRNTLLHRYKKFPVLLILDVHWEKQTKHSRPRLPVAMATSEVQWRMTCSVPSSTRHTSPFNTLIEYEHCHTIKMSLPLCAFLYLINVTLCGESSKKTRSRFNSINSWRLHCVWNPSFFMLETWSICVPFSWTIQIGVVLRLFSSSPLVMCMCCARERDCCIGHCAPGHIPALPARVLSPLLEWTRYCPSKCIYILYILLFPCVSQIPLTKTSSILTHAHRWQCWKESWQRRWAGDV